MTAFKSLMRVIAAALVSFVLVLGPKVIEWLHGPAPKDIPAGIWAIAGIVLVFLINLGLGKIPHPAPAEPEPPSASRMR